MLNLREIFKLHYVQPASLAQAIAMMLPMITKIDIMCYLFKKSEYICFNSSGEIPTALSCPKK